jgi:3-hydroxyisobutyrate dehydrogenase-like beta-hydroxyacid dehydrogenase
LEKQLLFGGKMQKNGKIGILHPGQMGSSIAGSIKNSGYDVYWTSVGRSSETRKRAESLNLIEITTLKELCYTCSVLISVCPPHAAEELAEGVLELGFNGLYLDANAISPQRVLRMGKKMMAGGVTFVDGGIIGGPAWNPGTTWLYLSGESANTVASFFSAGPLGVEVIGSEIGKASALKMCFAAYTKGSTALLCGLLAASERLGVRADLERQWSRGGSDFADQTQRRVRRVTAKAWRFAGEMDEISSTFEFAGLPGGFHQAAGDIYQRIAHFKVAEETPPLDAVLEALLGKDD